MARASDALRFHPREVVALAVLGLLLVGGAGLTFLRSRPVPADRVRAVTPASGSAVPTVEGASIVVHVVGEVRRAGVYRFGEGARVDDAVRSAGGFTAKADRAAVNLARPLADGEQISVPRRGATSAAGSGGAGGGGGGANAGGKININLASAAELETLPGVGPSLASKIIAYREQHGPFRSVKDLMKVSGIGPKKFESIEPHVTV